MKIEKVNLYEHDLRSGRKFAEFAFPKTRKDLWLILVTGTHFYTRDFHP